MGLIDKAKAAIAGDPLTRSGKVDPATGTHRATPWIEATDDALYTGLNRQVWMYRLLDNLPLRLADADELADHGRTLAQVLGDIGQTSIPAPPGFGVAPSGFYRNVHILVVRWYEQPEAPAGTPTRALADYLSRSALTFTSPRQAVFIGVQLRDLDAEAAARNQNVLDFAKDLANTLFKDNPTDYDGRYAADRDYLHQAMSRNGCRIPTQAELRQLEAWFTHGSHTEPEIAAYPNHLLIGHDRERVEFAALERMNAKVHRAPNAEWIADLMEHSDGPSVISLRFELQPAVDVRKALRKSIRSRRNAEEEARKANQVDRVEETDEHQLTEYAETLYAHAGSAPSLHNVSVIFGRRDNGYVRESYDEYLRNNYHIDVKPLTHRQIQALEETQPCAQKRANPFPQQQTLEVVAYAGLGMFTELGDPEGAFIGRGLPDGTPVFFDPMAPARRNLPPATFISGVPGSGKAQPLSAPVLTPTGWTTMGDIKVGGDVVGSDGQPTRVLAVYPQGIRPIYRLTFSDGATVEADAEHLWTVRDTTTSTWRNLTTEELINKGMKTGIQNRWSVPLGAPPQHPNADLPLDPYLIGTILGDGCISSTTSSTVGMTLAEPEMVELVRAVLPAGLDLRERANRKTHFTITKGAAGSGANAVIRGLDALGLMGSNAYSKRVPEGSTTWSIEQRLALLQGLMDTDGSVHHKTGQTRFSSSSEALALGVIDLVRSLGGTARVAKPTYPSYVYKGERRTSEHPHYVVSLSLPTELAPFRLERKRIRFTSRNRRTSRTLVQIDYVGEKEAQCILVDADDHLYVTSDYVITHNTWLSQVIAYQAVLAGYPVQMTNPKGADSLFPFAYWLQQQGVDVEWVAISRLAQSGGEGTYDPWRYAATPETAAMIASNLITTVLDFDQSQRTALRSGLTRGAKAGARSSLQALDYVNDEFVVRQVMHMWESTPLFQLCLGMQPKPRFDHASRQREQLLGQRPGKFVLTEFDVDLNLPGGVKDHYSDAERIGLSAVRAVTSASIGMLAGTTGGVYIVDEAHNVLGHPDTIGQIQKLMREGRSLGVSQIYISQLVSDLLQVGATGASLESYISRAFALKSTDDREAAAGLRLVGYEPTPERIEQMRDFGPKRTDAGTQPAYGYFRDLDGRKSIVSFGPYGEEFASAASTNIDDRRARELALDAGMEGQLA